MNERIQKLMDEAGIDVEAVENLGEMPTAIKFAQLMAEEFCKVLGKETIIHDGYGYNQHALHQKIKEHFEINERSTK